MISEVKIGLIEDDIDTILALQQMVARLDGKISFTAVAGEEIVRRISETNPPDLMLVALDPANSQERITLARQLRVRYKLPIIYMVRPAEEDGLEQLDPSEFSGFLLKPFSEKQLRSALKLALHQHRLEQKLALAQQHLEREISWRQQTEAALSQSQSRFRAVWEAAADSMALSDAEGKVIIANPAYYQLYQLTPEQVVGQDFAVIFPEEQREAVTQSYQATFTAEHLPPTFESRLTRPDGTELFVEAKATFLMEGQRRVAMLSVIRDISARKGAEEALKQANVQLKQRVEELSTLNFISRTLATVTDLQNALEIVAKTMLQLFTAHGTVVGLFNADQTALTLIVHQVRSTHKTQDLMGWTVPVTSVPVLAQIIQAPQTVLFSPQSLVMAASPFLENLMREHELYAGMIIPLRSRGELIGVIGMSTEQVGRTFTAAEIALAETLAGQVAGAIEVARLFYEERRQRRVAESLRQVTTVIQESLSEQQLLAKILAQLSPIIRHDSGGLLLQQQGHLVLAGRLGQTASLHLGASIPLQGQAPVIRVFKNRQLLLINDGENEPHWLHWPDGKKIGSWIGTPLIVHDQAIGVLTVSTFETGSYSEEDAQILQTFANQAALVIHKARLFEALRQSEAILNETQQIAKIGGWEYNLQSRRLTWTEEVYHLCELPQDYEPSLEASFNFFIPEHVPLLKEALRRAIRQGKPFDLELQIVTAQGRPCWIRSMGRAHQEEGKPVRLLGTIQDITERKRLEEQLRQSQKMEAVGQLAGGVAHHFNNMLMAITGYVELALEALSPDHPIAADLRLVQKTAERAATLTHQLLTFTRRQVTRPQLLDLNELIRQMQFMLRQFINETIEFKLFLAPDLKPVNMDAGQFEQLILSLVINARDAMPEGGQLTLKTANISLEPAGAEHYSPLTPGDYVLITISDTGVGMSEEIKPHIFEPFFTTKPVGQGTGLGLPTCLGIVQQHGGHIEIYSQIGQGTTLNVYLPSREKAAPPAREEVLPLPRGNETVLLVEDELQVRELIARVLRQQGYSVIEAGNGEEALRLVATQPDLKPQLLLTDVVMPRLGGKGLMAHLKKQYPHLKVLFISGYTDEVNEQQENILASKASLLAKPFTPAKLAQSVRAVLDAYSG